MADKPTYEELEQRISELEQNELACKKIIDGLSQAFSMSLDMTCIADIKTFALVKVNPAFTEILGYTEKELLGKPVFEFIHPDDIDATLSIVKEKLQLGEKVINFENRYRCKDGSYRYLNWVSHPNPEKGTAYAVARDITAQKETETYLEHQNQLMNTLLDNIQLGVFMVSYPTGKPLLANKRAIELLGRGIMDNVDKTTLSEVYQAFKYGTDELYPPHEMPIVKGLNGETHAIDDMVVVHPDGTKILLEVFGSPVKDSMGNIIASIVSFSDITDRKKNELQLQQALKLEAIGRFAGGIAHDFNNMLTVIIGNVSMVLSEIGMENPLFILLQSALDGARQAQKLANQVLTFSKGSAPIKKVTDLKPLIKNACQLVTSGSKSKCRFEYEQDVWMAEVDERQINQVVHNLVINADQAMSRGGVISIRAKNMALKTDNEFLLPEGPYVKISIEDQGTGIAKKQMNNIFDPFFTTKKTGSGLGLSIVYSIIKKHGGHIEVTSEKNKGTTFDIYLPASFKELSEEVDNKKYPYHSGQGRILIMDDETTILIMAQRMLGKMGYKTEVATDGAKAIDIYREACRTDHPFDLVILDITVPGGMGGAETIAELSRINPDIKAVVSSGYSTDPIMANYREYGFCGVLQKPYTHVQLAEVLNKILI